MMDEAFARKLRLWLVSMMTLLLGTVSASTVTLLGPSCRTLDPWSCIGMSGSAMVLFALLFVLLATWHALDLVQVRKSEGWLASWFSGYPALFGALSLLLALYVVASTGRFTRTRCVTPEPGTVVFDGCETAPHVVLIVPIYLLLLFVIILCMGKAVISIRSRLKKAA